MPDALYSTLLMTTGGSTSSCNGRRPHITLHVQFAQALGLQIFEGSSCASR
jgi:hypothetical protein